MSIIPLTITPTEIILSLSFTIVLYVVSLFLASKKIKGWRFFIWVFIIIYIPIIGSITYLIYHLANMKRHKMNITFTK